jgi:hypothetical protein
VLNLLTIPAELGLTETVRATEVLYLIVPAVDIERLVVVATGKPVAFKVIL